MEWLARQVHQDFRQLGKLMHNETLQQTAAAIQVSCDLEAPSAATAAGVGLTRWTG
jgi:hypothetical protein